MRGLAEMTLTPVPQTQPSPGPAWRQEPAAAGPSPAQDPVPGPAAVGRRRRCGCPIQPVSDKEPAGPPAHSSSITSSAGSRSSRFLSFCGLKRPGDSGLNHVREGLPAVRDSQGHRAKKNRHSRNRTGPQKQVTVAKAKGTPAEAPTPAGPPPGQAPHSSRFLLFLPCNRGQCGN